MGNVFGGWHLLVVILVILLLFGASRLPKLSKSLGESIRIFKRSVNGTDSEEKTEEDKESK